MPAYSILFDESLNHNPHDEQLDVQFRFWDKETIQVQIRYLDSRFFQPTSADNIVAELPNSTASLPEKKMLVFSMDGPNTNGSVLEKLKAHRDKNELLQILEIRSCGLHIVHGVFQTGVKATEWELDIILKAMWKLFR